MPALQRAPGARSLCVVFGRHTATPTRRCVTRRVVIGCAFLIAIVASNCRSMALAPRTTLEGRPFDIGKAEIIQEGLGEAAVRELLGEPLEATSDGASTQWRYYERFTPRGCNPPTLTQELRITFRDGLVVSRASVRPDKWP